MMQLLLLHLICVLQTNLLELMLYQLEGNKLTQDHYLLKLHNPQEEGVLMEVLTVLVMAGQKQVLVCELGENAGFSLLIQGQAV
jgi:hypothetical protein